MRRLRSIFRFAAPIALLAFGLLVTGLGNLMIGGVGAFMIYDGIRRGITEYPALHEASVRMTIVKVENRNHRRFLPDYEATGFVGTAHSLIEIPIFENQFRQLRAGDSLELYRLPSGEWLNREKLDESRPIFNLLGLHFSWHLPAGIIILFLWFVLVPRFKRIARAKNKQVATIEAKTDSC